MVKLSGNPVNPPDVDTEQPVETGKSWFGWAFVVAMGFVVLSIANNQIAPILGQLFGAVGLDTGEDAGIEAI